MRLVTLPGVFRPRSDAWLLVDALRNRVPPGGAVLDVFTGSGVVAIAAARAGARAVTAVDVSRRSVLCARLNARLNGVAVRALRGDLFAPVPGERFDLVVANPPYLPSEEEAPPVRGAARAWEGGRDGRALLDRLCDEAPARLASGGRLLLVQSSVSGIEPTIERLGAAGLRGEVISRRRGPLGPLLASRAERLEERGLLGRGEREEELVVVEAVGQGG
ncbi:MAG TPA: HemK2/MTQ2 family protein methyltransferase [Thermoleophilaceae bacterium]|nr:HemK2/MTQ2 family protein methyltransferase [Thermoleophilaceae bacterium]